MKKLFTLIALFAISLGAMAQVQYFYEWKNGTYTQRSITEVDSITFCLPETPTDGYKYVDLGLPSGTLWADRNVGADSPEAYGDYFAWGESTTKSTYKWSTYKWCRGSYDTQTKYCTYSSYGTVDNKTTLDLEDDAAYVNMGPEWRMPTKDEIYELTSKCTWTCTTQNGTYGYKVTGPNGNYIFLPAAGYCNDSGLDSAGSNGGYWSSSLYEGGSNCAWVLFFDSGGSCMYPTARYGGLPVRGVKNISKQQGSIVGVWSNGELLVKFNEDGTGYTEEEGEVTRFGYTFASNTGIVSVTDGVFFKEEIKQFKIKFIEDGIIQLGWWIDGEWIFEEDERYYRHDVVGVTVNRVDLGLPSGTLWADRNVGADSPEAYGDHYAWGETTTKSTYNWSTYKWCRGSYDTQTKYCTDSYYGTVDNKTTLDLEDDAAYVNMGKDWRMPTKAELLELKDKCTWTWTTQNGTKGYKVTGPNGNSIFLPAAGCRNYGSLYDAGSYGNCWASSLSESDPHYAWGLGFNSSDRGIGSGYYRFCGLSVRAVVR